MHGDVTPTCGHGIMLQRCIDHFAASKARTKCVGQRAALEEKLEA